MSDSINENVIGEFELIKWIESQVQSSERMSLGIGDDCAIETGQPDQDLLTSTDLLVEDVHFKRQWCSFYDLGRKSAAVNLSDIAAMGGKPGSFYLALARPRDISDEQIKQLISGFIAELDGYGAVLAGGDTCSSKAGLIISVTAQGWIERDQAICRNGASVGDAIYVSGTLGDSALALRHLLAGEPCDARLAQRFHLPTPRVELGRALIDCHFATAMLDVSDGLLSDLGHILRASAVGAELTLERIPLSEPFRNAVDRDAGLIDLALCGGEDYELVFTSPLKDLERCDGPMALVTQIGIITEQPGMRIKTAAGEAFNCSSMGFDHFA